MNKLMKSLCQWLRLNLLLLACMVVVRPIFFLEVYFRVGLEPIHFFTILSGVLFDAILVARVFTYGLIPFLLLHRFFPRTSFGVFKGLIIAYVVVSALLAEYYCNLTMPLDHVILVYTAEEVKTTLFSSASFSWAPVLWFVLQVGIPLLLLWKVRPSSEGSRLVNNRVFVWIVLAVFVLTTLFVRYPKMIRRESLYPAHYDFCLAVNQPSYSFVKITDFLKDSRSKDGPEEGDEVALQEAVEAYQASHPEFEYDTPGYPFYRIANDPDVLGPFLNATSDGLPPNLVFIIVESLGRRLTGVTNPMLSFTPFLDSLAAEGLFWPNCLSTSERTFGVLPSVFASAPHGRFGFSTPLAPTPRHHSLLLDLEQNGYTSSFYYGGDLSFDRYDFFMKANHVDYLFAPQVAVDDSAHYRLLVENNRWGLDDDQLFHHAIQHKRSEPTAQRPYVDIYMTLTTHEPFLVDNMEHYKDRVVTMVEQTPGLSDKERDNVMRNLNVYGCYLYTDESIRDLMAYYASLPDFENTVFVITGDHRMALVPAGISLRKYNVPLILWSPLLKQPKTMQAVVSHLDITPSVNAYLHSNYDYAIKDHCHWLGTSFDTVASYRNTRKQAFMLNNRDVVDFLDGKWYLTDSRVAKLDPKFSGTPVDDDSIYMMLKKQLADFDFISRYVVKNDVLIPQDAHTVLYDMHLDFERNTLEVFDKYLVRDSGYLCISDKTEYLSLCSDIVVRPKYENVVVEVSFDLRCPAEKSPILMVDCGPQRQQQSLDTGAESLVNTGGWSHFHTRWVVNTLEFEGAEALKVYLWNKAKRPYYVDNVVISVDGNIK